VDCLFGLAACVLIFLFVRHELSYDSWIPDAEKIFRIETTFNNPGQQPLRLATSPSPLKAALNKDYDDSVIDQVTRLFPEPMVVREGNRWFEETVTSVEGNFFNVFALKILRGIKKARLQMQIPSSSQKV